MSAIRYFGVFAIGGALGSAITYFVMKDKCNKEIKQVIDAARSVYNTEKKEQEVNNVEANDEELAEVKDISDKYKYRPESVLEETETGEEEPSQVRVTYKEPYEITYSEYGSIKDYACRDLVFYQNGILTEFFIQNPNTPEQMEYEEVVDNIAELIGVDTLCSFENGNEDDLYVRNDNLKCDFTIVYSLNEYKPTRKRPAPKEE